MPYACPICVAERGLKGEGIVSLPRTPEEFRAHLAEVHGVEVLGSFAALEQLGAMRRLGPGIYLDRQHQLHVRASEVLADLGVAHTAANESRLCAVLHKLAPEYGLGIVKEVLVLGD